MSESPEAAGVVGRGNKDGAALFRSWFEELSETQSNGGQSAYVFVMGSINEILKTFGGKIEQVRRTQNGG